MRARLRASEVGESSVLMGSCDDSASKVSAKTYRVMTLGAWVGEAFDVGETADQQSHTRSGMED